METQEQEAKNTLPEKADRIYDTLAQIFSGYSECVAIAQIGETVYVAANEVKMESNFLKGQILIQESIRLISDFLRDPSKDLGPQIKAFADYRDMHQGQKKQAVVQITDVKANPEMRDMIFCELVSPLEREKSALKQSGSLYTSQIHTDALKYAIAGHTTVSLEQIKKSVGHNEPMGGHAYLATIAQWEHLGKAIIFFNPSKKKFPELTWVYDEKDNVHAEMKILNQLLEDISTEKIGSGSKVYFGISKSCCFHCHHTLESAGKILKQHGIDITLSIRDSHDVSFGKTKDNPQPKWQFPSIIRKKNLSGYSELIQTIIPLIEGMSYQAFKENPSFVDTAMGANDASSSSAGEPNYAARHQQYLLAWEQLLQKSATIVSENSFSQEKHIVALGLLLHEQETFESLFDFDVPLSTERAKIYFDTLLEGIGKSNAENLFKFLKNPIFCGERLANCFAKIDENILKLSSEDPTPTSFTSPPLSPSTSIAPMQTAPVIPNLSTISVPAPAPSILTAFHMEEQKKSTKKRKKTNIPQNDFQEKPSSPSP